MLGLTAIPNQILLSRQFVGWLIDEMTVLVSTVYFGLDPDAFDYQPTELKKHYYFTTANIGRPISFSPDLAVLAPVFGCLHNPPLLKQ
ncbi:hypothetical protein [Parasitella parasitica]|uniref:Uncharacterized protein n=1 Tax=Parasitella parasitica TaxID=35722 RepID=A0A0B7NGP6_9FUNG|nr:hypothetical protein [Parasitella parasitica]